MGNSRSGGGGTNESRLAATKFAVNEIHVLRKTWQDLADRTGGKGIDRETFLQYFPLNGLLGERLFVQFDTKNTGFIDFDSFITGLAIICRGTMDEKTRFLFNMYDISHENTISKQELSTLLNHVPKSVLAQDANRRYLSPLSGDAASDYESPQESGEVSEQEGGEANSNSFDEVDMYTNHDLVEKAFDECDLKHEGRLNFEEFKMWVERTPTVLEYLESILPYVGPKDAHTTHDKIETLPGMHKSRSVRSTSVANLNSNNEHALNRSIHSASPLSISRHYSQDNGYGHFSTSSKEPLSTGGRSYSVDTRNSTTSMDHGPPPSPSSQASQSPDIPGTPDGDERAMELLHQAVFTAHSEPLRRRIEEFINTLPQPGAFLKIPEPVVAKQGFLWKKGGALHMWTRRWYLLSGNCMYYYSHQNDVRPKGVIFLTGSLVDKVNEEELKGYYGFELTHKDLCTDEHHRHEKRVLFTKSEEERDVWVNLLQHSAQVVPIEDDYVIGKELGRGRFSRVCECVNKVTGQHFAVKIIDKTTIEPEEKGLLRTEIAVLKLVNHPNIIRMEGLYESRNFLYIVMEMLKGGELFERIVGKPRFSESDAAKLIRPLLESVAYLHDLGIVHRDLKPENILCGENLEDLKIADFGLSKMLLPKERMDTACGTLSYVAPEVLTMQGYGKETDMWSVGVIMFLLVCGKLPFDGDDHDEIIRNTIQGEVRVNQAVWSKLSEEARGLMLAMLNKNPKERISAREALRSPFITKYFPYVRKSGQIRRVDSVSSNVSDSAISTSSQSQSSSNQSFSALAILDV